MWDHLRVCGADDIVEASDSADKGSPPRVRSRRWNQAGFIGSLGITSACAEQTVVSSEVLRPDWDHLRVCGADARLKASQALMQGSSPRVRSRHHAEVHVHDRLGIISACAEQTTASNNTRITHRDHLRVCGADFQQGMQEEVRPGSSPRVRSRHRRPGQADHRERIISACAEQTRPRTARGALERDHLRVCGADVSSSQAANSSPGSSPRVRSRLRVSGAGHVGERIISACAEQTSPRWTSVPAAGDHLRVCGADRGRLVRLQGGQGSSPRVRSRLSDDLAGRIDLRIISACAEQTMTIARCRYPDWDHLRVCGADPVDCRDDLQCLGSSPRVRSRLGKSPYHTAQGGIISACAEQTKYVCASTVAP